MDEFTLENKIQEKREVGQESSLCRPLVSWGIEQGLEAGLGWRGVLIPQSRSFHTTSSHPELLSSPVSFPNTTTCAKILANPASRVAVTSRIQSRNIAFSRIPYCISFKSWIRWCSSRPSKNCNTRKNRFFSGDSRTPGPFCSSAATLARFFWVEIFSLVGESNTKFARHIACCAWWAVKWVTRQV